MNNFNFITPSELLRRHPDCEESLDKLRQLANQEDHNCENCGEPAWKYGESGLCFSCTTGESDASDDYELIPEANSGHIQN